MRRGRPRTVCHRSRRAAPKLGCVAGRRGSRTHRKNGIMKAAYQSATSGPTKRVPSRHVRVEAQCRFHPDKGPPTLVFGEEDQHHEQREHPAHVAPRETRARQPPDGASVAQFREHRVGEDRRELDPDEPDPESDQRPDKERPVRQHEPQRGCPRHVEDREEHDPRHPSPGVVGECPEDRRQKRDEDAGHRLPQRPEALGAGVGHLFGQSGRHEHSPWRRMRNRGRRRR